MSSKLVQALKGLTREGISKLSDATSRFDDWQNQVTGFGTSIDKTTYTQFVGSLRLSDQALSNLYHGDDLAARMIDIVPDEMLREGFTVELGDAGLNSALSEQAEALGLDAKLADAWRWGRLYGGAALLLGADDGRSAMTPLVPEKAKSLAYVHVLDRRYLWPINYYTDPGNPKVGTPETYMVSAASSHTDGQGFAVVHESRLVLFGGATTGIREREQNSSWDHSVLQRAVQPLAAFNTGWKAVELLLTDANQAVFKMSGLAEVLGAGGEEVMKKRMQMVDLCRSVMRAMVIDAGGEDGTAKEEFTRQSASFSDIPQTLDKFMLRLAAAVQIPVTILMGQSPAGMSATGDSDFRWFYDRIRSEQTRKLSPKIRRIVKVMLATKAFNKPNPERVEVRFPALWTEPPLGAAQTRKTLLEGDAIATTNGFLVAAEVAAKRFGEANGFDSEIQLTDEGKKAREAELKGDLEDLSKPPDEREPPPDAGGGGFGGGGNFDADDQPRDDNGQFASTDGGGASGSSGKGSSAAALHAHAEKIRDRDIKPGKEEEHLKEYQAAREAAHAALVKEAAANPIRQHADALAQSLSKLDPNTRVLLKQQLEHSLPGATSKDAGRPDGGAIVDGGKDLGCPAYHEFGTGKVVVGAETRASAEAASRMLANGEFDESFRAGTPTTENAAKHEALIGLKQMVHEELHGFSRSTPESYRGIGRVLEEVGTEVGARQITAGLHENIAQSALARSGTLFNSYQTQIDGVANVLQKEMGLSREQAHGAIFEAHRASVCSDKPPFRTSVEHLSAFVGALAATPEQAQAVRTGLLRVRLR